MEVSTGRINLLGYLVAKYADDYLLLEAYQKCRFIGAKMPFIDPLKEPAPNSVTKAPCLLHMNR
ncbi:MAG: hypothetical protein JXB49_16350 [Bacteroidales bacterium]|nr:hypothetical protein [Bacteroidales bacterium]